MQRAFSTAGLLIVTSVLSVSAQPGTLGAAKRTTATKGAAATKTPPTGAVSASAPHSTPGLFLGTRPNIFTTIQGNALDSTNAALPNHAVRLRDVRFGRIVETTTTDKSGLFAFRGVDPGSYVVELVGNDQTVLAASQILYVDAGEAVSAIVKLPFRIPPFGGLLGHTAASAAAISSAAAASGLLATAVTGTHASPSGKPIIR
jgi:hypothetical protein